jgi:teichuronic acid biosynthesis protein TuaE
MQSCPTGFYGNPNNLAVFMLTILPFFLFLKKTYLRVFGIFFVFTVIIFTGSRGCFIAFVAGIGIYFLLKNKRLFFTLIISFIVLFVFSSTIIDSLKESKNERISDIAYTGEALITYLSDTDDSGGSISIRQNLIKNGIAEFYKTKGLGVGGGASMILHRSQGMEEGSMHNFWIEILVEGGILMFLLFVFWFVSLTYKLYSVSCSSKDDFIVYVSKSLFLSMCMFSIGCISASSVIYNLTAWLMYGMGIAIIYINKINERNKAT